MSRAAALEAPLGRSGIGLLARLPEDEPRCRYGAPLIAT